MITEWILWEKEEGRIAVSRLQDKEKHRYSLICDFIGALDEAIKLAERLEKDGYSIIMEDAQNEPGLKAEVTVMPEPDITAETEESSSGVKTENEDIIPTSEIISVTVEEKNKEYCLPEFMEMEDFTERKKPKKKKETRIKPEKTELSGQLSLEDLFSL